MPGKKKTNKDSIEILKFNRPDEARLLYEIIDLAKIDREIPETHHRHDFFEIIIVLKGSTKHLVDFKEYTIKKNEILIIPQNSIHQGSFKEDLAGFIILFTKDFFTNEQYNYLSGLEIFSPSYGSNLFTFNKSDWDEIYRLLQSLIQEYAIQKQTPGSNTFRFLLLAFNAKLNSLSNYSSNSFSGTPSILRLFFELLENDFTKEHSVAFYSNKLNITSKKLTQTLSKATGKTALNLITERLVLEAKRELLFSKKTIKEIAFYLGFEDQLYFSKFFKKYSGMTPQNQRRDFAGISI